MFQANSSSLLELEAADYFKLDPAQMNMLCNSSSAFQVDLSSAGATGVVPANGRSNSTMNQTATTSSSRSSVAKSQTLAQNSRVGTKPMVVSRQRPQSQGGRTTDLNQRSADARIPPATSPRDHHQQQGRRSRASNKVVTAQNAYSQPQQDQYQHQNQEQQHLIYSSTNSLPSISSSPSISPSLVCPHLTLDDILNGRYVSRSPHTIGLCNRCKLDPPPNIHSPLSPAFKPSNAQSIQSNTTTHRVTSLNSNQLDLQLQTSTPSRRQLIQRGYSDLNRRTSDAGGGASFKLRPTTNRDDSLDFCLDANEFRRSQMSPIQRNSVEFIRKHSTEVGRVLKVYKNGQAFEKPLRICITRGEFANLNQLLDHINSRQLIPCGARYLFHLDGQLVYSVNELKHGSSYVVSGTRSFDVKASTVIKEQQKRELNQAHHLHEQLLQRRLLDRRSSRSLGSLAAGYDDSAEAAVTSYNNFRANQRPEPQLSSKQPEMDQQTRSKTSQTLGGSNNQVKRVNVNFGRKPTDSIKQQSSDSRTIQGSGQMRVSRKHLALGGNRRVASKRGEQQTVGGEQKSQSSENLAQSTMMDDTTKGKQQSNLSRAKSELSSSALKKKKNVTFMDTGQMSSPVMRRSDNLASENGPEVLGAGTESKTAGTVSGGLANRNEIGIQVSDSIDGFLIDLPMPLPIRGDERREQQESRRKFVTPRGNKPHEQESNGGRRKKIVTITERDLSIDELDQLKDLDHGDHYKELHKIKHVVIKLDSADASTSTIEADETEQPGETPAVAPDGNDKRGEEDVEPIDRSNTINIGQEVNETDAPLVAKSSGAVDLDESKVFPVEQWQYPGGQSASATPEERPVSQNEPNGVVHARVTTPTPSLSTAGDNNSLSMSYDGLAQVDGRQQHIGGNKIVAPRAGLPAKCRLAVRGNLTGQLEAPGTNFKLTWVNGFTINDAYPENSTTVAHATAVASTSLVVETTAATAVSQAAQGGELLSPPSRQGQAEVVAQVGSVQFKPSERFRNWICHSRLHDELIYPAGCLVVLWCRWLNEQRYYSRHLTNISAITLAPSQPDVVASSEIGAASLMTGGAVIHLWSSTSLETLMIIDEPAHFRGLKIFSLNLLRSPLELGGSFNLQIGSRDDKQPATLQLLNIKVDLGKKEDLQGKRVPAIGVLKASRVLQANQTPLYVTHVPIESDARLIPQAASAGDQSAATTAERRHKRPPKQANGAKDLMLSFGRRHFQLWSADWPRQKLQLMQTNEKNSTFVELITRSNCIARLAPSEFLIGDSIGNITLVIIDLSQQQKQQQTPSKSPLKPGGSPKLATAGGRYTIETVRLVEQQQLEPRIATQKGSNNQSSSVTSLARISGSIFASGHSDCVVRFWKIDRSRKDTGATSGLSCRQLTCISLPADLGFICSIVSSGFNRRQSIVEFYLISTSNAILFGSIQLASLHLAGEAGKPNAAPNVLDHSSLTVVYEGHESSVTNLVSDWAQTAPDNECGQYFTCSLDFRICKWAGHRLVWKSMLPSACVSLACHPTGFVLAIGSADGTVYVLDKISGLLISYFPLTPVCINCLSYSRDGSLLAAGCSNGSIFILPVQEKGLKYKKVSIFQSPFPVVSLQFSLDNRYLLTSVTHSQFQDLILWDLPNFRYMRDNVKMVADKIGWFEPVCSGSEDVRAIWENINLVGVAPPPSDTNQKATRPTRKRPLSMMDQQQQQVAVNLSCHRLIETIRPDESLCLASDTRGYLRLFRYPCRDIEQAFYQARVTSSPMNCCRFLAPKTRSLVSSALDGSIFLWTLE